MRWLVILALILFIVFIGREYKKLNAIEYFSDYKEDDDGVLALAYYGGL